MRQRRNAEGSQRSEARVDQQRAADQQRLEAAEYQRLFTEAETRKQTIQSEFTTQDAIRDTNRQAYNQGIENRRAAVQEIATNAQQRQAVEFQANVSRRAQAVKERQRDVFQLQMNFAEDRRFVRENPLNVVGDEALQNIALSRTGENKFKEFQAAKGVVLDRIEQGRGGDLATRDKAAQSRDGEQLVKAKERSQNIRRRLKTTYGGQPAKAAGQSRGRL